MALSDMGLAKFLRYGAIGLGLALAILAYLLLHQEQAVVNGPRRDMLTAIYVFMAFALVLTGGGLLAEQKTHRLNEARRSLDRLLEIKGGAVDQLGNNPALTAEVQRQLKAIDEQIRKTLSDK